MWQAIVFDLDGTLIDSQYDIFLAMRLALGECGVQVREQDLDNLRGAHLSLVWSHFRGLPVGEIPPEEIRDVSARYRKHYLERMFDHTRPFEGVIDTLNALTFIRKAIATAKPMEYAEKMIAHFSLNPYFEYKVGSGTLPPKPDPAVFLKAMELLKVDPSQTLAVGDTRLDMVAAQAAGMKTCLVDYKNEKPNLDGIVPDYTIREFREILKLAK